MKLSEIKRLFEEPIEVKEAADLWSENESDAASYITSTVYYVKPSTEKQGFFDVTFDDDNNKRKVYGTISKDDLDAAFTPLRGNQSADAEGYLQYRSADVYDAFKYGGDPVKVNVGDNPDDKSSPAVVLMNKGDYLLRQTSKNDFTYSVEKANYFDNGYVRKT